MSDLNLVRLFDVLQVGTVVLYCINTFCYTVFNLISLKLFLLYFFLKLNGWIYRIFRISFVYVTIFDTWIIVRACIYECLQLASCIFLFNIVNYMTGCHVAFSKSTSWKVAVLMISAWGSLMWASNRKAREATLHWSALFIVKMRLSVK